MSAASFPGLVRRLARGLVAVEDREAGRCVAVNGKRMTPLQVITEANAIGGRNGLGVSHALENRIIGTKSRGAAPPAPPRSKPVRMCCLR